MLEALLHHWPEYLIEGALLGVFMIAACTAVVVLEHPASPVPRAVRGAGRRRVVIGLLMGLTAIGLIYSPWGARSGAHMNPGVTLTFWVLGKVGPWDALFYISAQFLGGLGGVLLSRAVLGRLVSHERVRYAATVPPPGQGGARTAWIAEFVIAFLMMGVVLLSSNVAALAPYTGIFAGALVAVYIAVEAPLSGMSLNPARTLASAIPAREFRGVWIYFTAPPLAMLAAAGLYTAVRGAGQVYCAKLEHGRGGPCLFNCRIEEMPGWDRGVLRAGAGGIRGSAAAVPKPRAVTRRGR